MKVRMVKNEKGEAAQIESRKILHIVVRNLDVTLVFYCFECYGKPQMTETHQSENRLHSGDGTRVEAGNCFVNFIV